MVLHRDNTSDSGVQASQRPMPCWSLRGLISGMTVASVVAVATITLAITLVVSMHALEDIADKSAFAILANAKLQTQAFFNTPVDAGNVLRNLTYRSRWLMPTQDASVAQRFADYCVAATRPARLTAAVWFADNTRILSVYDTLVTHDEPAISQLQVTLPSVDGTTFVTTTTVYKEGNLTQMSPVDIADKGVPPFPFSFVRNGPLWAGLLRPSANGTAPFFLGLQAKSDYHGRGSVLSVTYVVPLQRSTDRPGAPFAVAILQLSVASINSFLKASAELNGAAIFAYTSLGTLIASSVSDQVPISSTFWQARPRDPVPPNCMTDDTFTPASSEPSNGTWFVCVTQLADYPDSGVAAAATGNIAFSPVPTVTSLTVNGVAYIMASGPVSIGYPGASVHLLTSIEESSVTGSVVRGRNIAIGVTAGAVVVIALSSFALVTVLLRPLSRVAARMELAARLDEDAEPMAPSSVAEVRALQYSLDAMSTELLRIRSFVPHSVTASNTQEDAIAASVQYDVESTCSMSESPLSQQSKRHSAAANTFMASRQLNIALGLTTSSVAVLVANCEGFLPKMVAASRDDATRDIADLVGWVVEVVNAHGGVLTSFHGDHFVATFNAAKPCSSSTRRAATVAVALCSRPRDTIGLNCRVTAGLSTGRCLVGNVGCVGAMNFATIGAPYTQATVLQRLNRYYKTSVLTTQRTLRSAEQWFNVKALDVIRMPTDSASQPSRTTVVGAILDAFVPSTREGDEHGFYVVSEDASEDLEGLRQEVFECIAKGQHLAASTALERLERHPLHRGQVGDGTKDPILTRLVEATRQALQSGEAGVFCASDLGPYYAQCVCRQ